MGEAGIADPPNGVNIAVTVVIPVILKVQAPEPEQTAAPPVPVDQLKALPAIAVGESVTVFPTLYVAEQIPALAEQLLISPSTELTEPAPPPVTVRVKVGDATCTETAELIIWPSAAVTIVVPCASPVRNPALTVAMVLGDVDHSADEVTFWVDPSLYVAVAVIWIELPAVTCPEFGETLIETSDGPVTVSWADALTLPSAAEMLVMPCISPDASPPPLTEATAGTEEVQLAD